MSSAESGGGHCLRGASIPVVFVAGVGLVMAIALFSLASRQCAEELGRQAGGVSSGPGWHAWAILVSALVLTGLLTAYFLGSVRYARRMAVLARALNRSNQLLWREAAARGRDARVAARTQRLIEFVLGATKTGLDIVDAQFNLRYVDSAWARAYGPWAGRKCYEYFMDRIEPCPGCGMLRALASKKSVVTEKTLAKEGNRTVQVTSIPIQDKGGEWLVAELSVDVTEHARRAAELAAAWEARLSADEACQANSPPLAGAPGDAASPREYPWRRRRRRPARPRSGSLR